jgi:hypothetical protein
LKIHFFVAKNELECGWCIDFSFYIVVLTSCNVYGSGCRVDASEAAMVLLPSNITVFALDFSGSGISGGEHVTLGWNEVSAYSIMFERIPLSLLCVNL